MQILLWVLGILIGLAIAAIFTLAVWLRWIPVRKAVLKPTEIQQQQILGVLVKSYQTEQMRQLCSDLNVDYDKDIAGNHKNTKALSLIYYMRERGMIDQLIEALKRERPEEAAEIISGI